MKISLAFAFIVAAAVVASLADASATVPVRRSDSDPVGSASALLARVLGSEVADGFVLSALPRAEGGKDVFVVSYNATSSKPSIAGSSGVAIASGAYRYLRRTLNATISWGASRGLPTPDSLPLPPPSAGSSGRFEAPDLYRYYLNVCTVGYSAVWWTWERWAWEIDFAAMNGVNLMLSFTGQEYVWNKFYLDVGLTQDEIDEWLAGPAFMPWQRMGNLVGWPSAVPAAFREQQMQLQLLILERQRSLGMISVLPAFAGHVPTALQRLYPSANLTRTVWNGFPSSATLDPSDPHFVSLGQRYLTIQSSVYGTDSVYQVDTYNEMLPPSTDPGFLANSSAAVYASMRAADPNAVWLMQGWLFVDAPDWWTPDRVKAYLSGVSDDDMVVLDLYSDYHPGYNATSYYFGKPWIWCMLLDFGGERGLFGDLDALASGPATQRAHGTGMVGTGTTPEAIENNVAVFDLHFETGLERDAVDVDEWLASYVTRRYGLADSSAALSAWQTLRLAVYGWPRIVRSAMVLRPGVNITSAALPRAEYSATGATAAWRMLQAALKPAADEATTSYDLVDLGRQVMANLFYDVRTLLLARHAAGADVSRLGAFALSMFDDLDRLLASDTNGNFLLGRWTEAARSLGGAAGQTDEFDFNAKNQITLWGPNGNISDYAAKQWSGLVSTYYRPRWSMFVDALAGPAPLNVTRFRARVLRLEQGWGLNASQRFPTEPSGERAFDVSAAMLERYASHDATYTLHDDTRFSGPSLVATPAWTRDPAQLMVLCDELPACSGFVLPDGLLSTYPVSVSSSPGSVFYEKPSS